MPHIKKRILKVLNFIKENRTIHYSAGLLFTLVACRNMVPFNQLARLLSDSTLVAIAGKHFTKEQVISILRDLKSLPESPLPDLLNDYTGDPSSKMRKIEIHLGTIENIQDSDLKNSLIICLVTIITDLYSSNSSNFNTLVEALLNALKHRYLSKRLFEIILRMLINRNVPIEEIIEAIKNR